ncbi:MAG: hypothetical protein L3J63_08960 [Geopsychrobacter sp.]|nr:hypothetical protein [Geopsychrobacter sp.]
MFRVKLLLLLVVLSSLISCQRTGYETLRQIGYQECLKNSAHPAEDCQQSPEYDSYQRQRKERYPD